MRRSLHFPSVHAKRYLLDRIFLGTASSPWSLFILKENIMRWMSDRSASSRMRVGRTRWGYGSLTRRSPIDRCPRAVCFAASCGSSIASTS